MQRFVLLLLMAVWLSVPGTVLSACVTLTWTASGDDGNTGTASQYDLRYSTGYISESNWSQAAVVTGVPTPGPAGTAEQCEVCNLEYGTTYTFGIKVADEAYNWSELSNIVIRSIEWSEHFRGDINLNGIPFEVSDIVVFTNYFTAGLSAFSLDLQLQVAETDVDHDNIVLTVADLAFLVRVVVDGDIPNQKIDPFSHYLRVTSEQMDGIGTVTTDAANSIAVAYLVYDLGQELANIEPTLAPAASSMDMAYSVADDKLRILVFNIGSEKIEAGNNTILEIPFAGDGGMRLVEAQFADYYGRLYRSVDISSQLPDGYRLDQNYPNPFNPTTQISFFLPQASRTKLTVYNTLGQKVRTVVDGTLEAGAHVVDWDGLSYEGRSVASGVYLYRLEAGEYIETRKMILLK